MTLTSLELTQPNDPLSLIHPKLIDWYQTEPIDIPIFLDDEAVANFLCSSNPETSFTSESHHQDLNQESAKFLRCKINNIKDWSNGENQKMIVLDHEKEKRKSVSDGENLLKALKDEKLDTLP